MARRACLFIALALLLSGCAATHYKQTRTGTLSGALIVEWRNPDFFIFRPDPASPLLFVRSDGTRIQPGLMYTDGGSIPRPFWSLRNYSPWGYGPAFIVHDWLFHMQNCKLAGYDRWTIQQAATVMSEVMKTMMETPGFDFGSQDTVYLMYAAVQTPPAEKSWTSGACLTPAPGAAPPKPPDLIFRVEFPPKR
ncbi:MAG TPA: DUF1353 domain-containing protein [Methylomirabilota bacterium]|jgi:hypothetical protein|nr:DUF1353 domain-containing protein [Methylomirabilota bacterium]